jgi:hypothetical protein
MAAEFHLAEDALALHLLLKHLEGLVDIVVTDKNLHAAFLFDRAMMGPMAKNARATGADRHSPDADGTRRKNQRSIFENVPADRHHGCQLEETKASVRRRFLGSSSDKHSAYLYNLNGRAGDKEQ